MILVLFGKDAYRRQKRAREAVGLFKKENPGAAERVFDMKEPNALDEFGAFLRTRSLFAAAKYARLENALDPADAKKTAAAYKEAADLADIFAVIAEDARPTGIFSFLAKGTAAAKKGSGGGIQTEEFEPLAGIEWEAFVKKEAGVRDLKFEAPALRFFSDVYEGESWRAATELEKLTCAVPHGKSVGKEDLEKAGLDTPPVFWGLVQALARGDRSARLAALHTALASKEPAAKLFNIVAYQAPGRLELFAAYDAAIKSGRLDYEEALADFAIS